MAAKYKKRQLHIGEGPQADALVDSFHELCGSMTVPAFEYAFGSLQSSHVSPRGLNYIICPMLIVHSDKPGLPVVPAESEQHTNVDDE